MAAAKEAGIPIGKKFTLLHDGMCWVTVEHPTKGERTRTDAKGNVSLIGHRKYFNDVTHALRAIYNKRLKGVKSIEDLTAATERHQKELRKVGEEIRDAIDRVGKKAIDK